MGRRIVPILVVEPASVIGGVIGLSLRSVGRIVPQRKDLDLPTRQNRVHARIPERCVSIMQVIFLQETDQLLAGIRTDLVLIVPPEIDMADGAVQCDNEAGTQRGEELPLFHILGQQHSKQQNVIQINGQKIPGRPLVTGNEDARHRQIADPCIQDQEAGKAVFVLGKTDKRRCRDHKDQNQRIEIVDKLAKARE